MSNEIELNEEQLASVTGGKGFNLDITSITQGATNSLSQGNAAFAPTVGFATSGKHGSTSFAQEGAQIGLGNIAVQSAQNSI
jgi:bacteriocin-like protein